MPPETQKDIQVFISYSWTTPEHINWVRGLATRLQENEGIHVTLDQWDLKTGHDVNAFMERMANDNTLIDKVVVVSDKSYTEKANNRTRGVGVEAQIISAEVFEEINQEKFLPVVREHDKQSKPYLPVFLKSRKYIDFSKDDDFEEAYIDLLRDIISRPEHTRPTKKVPLPSFLFDGQTPRFKTNQIARGIDSVLVKNPKQMAFKIPEFLDEFFLALEGISITITDPTWLAVGKLIVDKLEEYSPLRDDLLLFFDKILRSGVEFDIDRVINFLSKLPQYTDPSKVPGQVYDAQFDVYKVIIHELFLSLMGLFLKHEQYQYVEDMLYSNYTIETPNVSDRRHTYHAFYKYVGSVDDYYKQLKNTNLSIPWATLLYDRASEHVTSAYLIAADLISYHMGDLNGIRISSSFDGNWFPILYIYQSYASLDLFKRLSSKRYFDKVKGVYQVTTPEELRDKLDKYTRAFGTPLSSNAGPITQLQHLIDIDRIAKDR